MLKWQTINTNNVWCDRNWAESLAQLNTHKLQRDSLWEKEIDRTGKTRCMRRTNALYLKMSWNCTRKYWLIKYVFIWNNISLYSIIYISYKTSTDFIAYIWIFGKIAYHIYYRKKSFKGQRSKSPTLNHTHCCTYTHI